MLFRSMGIGDCNLEFEIPNTMRLLEQNGEQNQERGKYAKELADLFIGLKSGHKSAKARREAETTFAVMLSHGIAPDAIKVEILRPGRVLTEPIWELEKRLTKGSRPTTEAEIAAEIERQRRAKNESI